jgi:hypothetical protein
MHKMQRDRRISGAERGIPSVAGLVFFVGNDF